MPLCSEHFFTCFFTKTPAVQTARMHALSALQHLETALQNTLPHTFLRTEPETCLIISNQQLKYSCHKNLPIQVE